MRHARIRTCLAIALVLVTAPLHAQTVLVRDGQSQATIVLPAEPTKDESLAAKELVEHIERMSGAKLPVVKAGERVSGVPVYIGSAAPQPEAEKVRAKSVDVATFRIHVTPKLVQLTGNSDEAALYATYTLLHQLGVRWLIPGEVGVDVLPSKTVTLKEQDTIEAPGFRGRRLQPLYDDGWAARNLLGGFNAGSHGLGPTIDRKTRPNLFYQQNGKPTGQEIVSHPEVLREVVSYWRKELEKNPKMQYVNVGPHDGAGFGEDPWDADDFDPVVGRRSTTDRYIRFFNLILEDLQKDYPDVGLAFYAYTQEIRPPVRETPNPKILPIFAPISLDRFHSIDNPISWEKQYLRGLIDGWQTKGVQMMFRGYYFNLADHGMPFSMIDIIRDEVPYYHEKGFIAMRVETMPNWGYHAPALYLAARLYWDPKRNADAEVSEWFDRMYGPAAPAMKEHFDLVENAYIHADYFTGSTFDIPKILTPEVRKKMGQTLSKAEKVAGKEGKYADRLKIVRIAYEYGEANFKMMDAFNRGEFAEARKHHDTIVNEWIPAIKASKPAIISEYPLGYFKRFWSESVVSGSERVMGGREKVVSLPDEWVFMADPFKSGEQLLLYKAELGTQSWMPIKTWSESTSNQGLRYYKGAGFYRCSVKVPEKYAGRKLRLWLGSIDDTADAWVNGKPLTVITKGWAPNGKPWEFDATEAIMPGKENVIVVKVTDTEVDELGTFGINGPAMIWAEAAGE
jgi:hypothetical protein